MKANSHTTLSLQIFLSNLLIKFLINLNNVFVQIWKSCASFSKLEYAIVNNVIPNKSLTLTCTCTTYDKRLTSVWAPVSGHRCLGLSVWAPVSGPQCLASCKWMTLLTQHMSSYFNGLPPTKLHCVEPDSIWEMEEYHLHTPLL